MTIRIERGDATAEELAALVSVLAGIGSPAPARRAGPSLWWRSGLPQARITWRESGLPRLPRR